MTNLIVLRDTISKQTVTYEEGAAEKWLNHPVFGKRLEVVRSDKPEVLGESYIIVDGKRQYIDDAGNAVKKADAKTEKTETEASK